MTGGKIATFRPTSKVNEMADRFEPERSNHLSRYFHNSRERSQQPGSLIATLSDTPPLPNLNEDSTSATIAAAA